MGRSQNLYIEAKKIIPGGTQLLSKRPELHLPDLWPAYYKKAKGCKIWDLDGRQYIDMSYMGIGSCILGYADKDVNNAVLEVIDKGSMSTLNSPEEIKLAKVLCRLHPWAGMVRYARCGGEAMAIAIRIARAYMRKDIILFCGYHGWHDWYLAANLAEDSALDGHLIPGLAPKGVPRILKGTAIPFQYNDTDMFLRLMKKYKGKIAAVAMEPVRNYYPKKGFLETIRKTSEEAGVTLIFDEVSAGWRLTCGGSHLYFNIHPDIAVFAKGMSNGYPMAAIIGKKDVMNSAQETFISSTYWTERIGPAAALATIMKLEKNNVPGYLGKIGNEIQAGWKRLAADNGLDIKVFGIPPLCHFSFNYDNPLVLKTLFTQEMLKRGFLAASDFYASYAHRMSDVGNYLKSAGKAFALIAKAIKNGRPQRYLKGPVCHSGFKRLA